MQTLEQQELLKLNQDLITKIRFLKAEFRTNYRTLSQMLDTPYCIFNNWLYGKKLYKLSELEKMEIQIDKFKKEQS